MKLSCSLLEYKISMSDECQSKLECQMDVFFCCTTDETNEYLLTHLESIKKTEEKYFHYMDELIPDSGYADLVVLLNLPSVNRIGDFTTMAQKYL